ncbi:MAG: hypothetical protein HKN47_03700 [Pirellulaceae bacterium]|nr:hypothetical protein [Pirellulaceae bacterium]
MTGQTAEPVEQWASGTAGQWVNGTVGLGPVTMDYAKPPTLEIESAYSTAGTGPGQTLKCSSQSPQQVLANDGSIILDSISARIFSGSISTVTRFTTSANDPVPNPPGRPT